MPDDSERVAEERTTSAETASGLSRRRVLTAGAVAGGAVAGLTGITAAEAEAEAATGRVALGPTGTTTVEFRAMIQQTGPNGGDFRSFGYLTRLSHTRPSDLFDGASRSAPDALFTAFATGDLRGRIHESTVHTLDIVGTLTVYQRRRPGADFADPGSFRVGKPVARYEVVLHDVLAVYATGKGLPTLSGDMYQRQADAMTGRLAGRVFGRNGARLRFFATGMGTLLNPDTLNSVLEIAGNWSVE
jgi:hypothetical protein